MKKPFYTLSWIKQNVYTLLFYFLRLSCSYSSHSLHHPYGKELKPSFQEDARFLGRSTSAYIFHFILRHPSSGLSSLTLL